MNSKQKTLGLWGKGVYKTRSGHLRYSSPPELRGEYVHRKVVKDLIEEMTEALRQLLPWPYEVHHIDFNKEHNWPQNLLLLSNEVHSALTAGQKRDEAGRFSGYNPKWKPAPPWALSDQQDDSMEVPF
jgi:hypothetical protein